MSELLFKKYLPLVRRSAWAVARRVPSNVLHEDLLAWGSIGLWDAICKSNGELNEGYLQTRIKGAIFDGMRLQNPGSRRKGFDDIVFEEFGDEVPDIAETPEELFIAREASLHSKRIVRRALRRLKHRREIDLLVRHYVDDEKQADIAAKENISGPRVSQLVRTGAKLLRAELRKEA